MRRLLRFSPWTFLAPAFVLLGVFRFFPTVYSVWISLTDWNGFSSPRYIGLANFRQLLHDQNFRGALINNLYFAAAIPLWVALPVLIALLLNTKPRGWRIFRFALFVPALLPPLVAGLLFSMVFAYGGPLNTLLRAVGLSGLTHQWLVERQTAIWVLIAVVIWASYGVGVLIILSGLGSLNPELEEAAQLDGASWLRTQWHVVLPQLRPIVEFWTVIVLIFAFGGLFPFVYALTAGGPGTATYVGDFFVFQTAFRGNQFGYAAAAGVVLFVLVFLPSAVGLWVLSRRSQHA
jgi:ABC-type sugar transport system permease subunit